MPKPPTPLMVRDEADQRRQRHMHVCNAVALALNNSLMLPLDSAPVMMPHGQQKADYTGSDKAAVLERAKAKVIELERQWRDAGTDWERAERLEGQIVAAQARAERLTAELGSLGSLQPRASHQPGQSGLYWVRPAPILYSGHLIGVYTLGPYTLDTRTLSDDLRARLWRYLDSGASLLPYWHCQKRSRYYATSRAPADLLALIDALTAHLLPSEREKDAQQSPSHAAEHAAPIASA